MNVKKQAAKDAARWARAEMFFGEGAGNRRKLLWGEIYQRGLDLGEKYQQAFERAYASEDMAKHAIAAAKERQHLDRVSYIGKNARALLRGDLKRVSPSVYLIAVGAYYAHVTGYDKKAWDWSKGVFDEVRRQHRAKYELRLVKDGDELKTVQIDLDKPYGGQ